MKPRGVRASGRAGSVMGPRLPAAASALKEGLVSIVVSWDKGAADGVENHRGPVRIGGASERIRLGQAFPTRTRQGRMVVVAVMMRETAHGAGSIDHFPTFHKNGHPGFAARE